MEGLKRQLKRAACFLDMNYNSSNQIARAEKRTWQGQFRAA